MATWRNPSGRPLSSEAWLDAHHAAKLPERTRFAETLVQYQPLVVVDIGCGTGLWLDLLDQVLPPTCEFVGVDSDGESLVAARKRATRWQRRSEFLQMDVEREPDRLPQADLLLMFNVLPYLPDAATLIRRLRDSGRFSRLALRQYDGTTIRLGPIPPHDRFAIDASLHAAIGSSGEFGHYEMDRAFALIRELELNPERIEFELTERFSPFPTDFEAFFSATLSWLQDLLSEDAASRLRAAEISWDHRVPGGTYFSQVDLVAVLSA